ncbi:MAG: DUF2071 domain-containing protein [Chthoniobacterales bacterium]
MQPFLTANWRYLAMLNYTVDPAIVAPFVPPATEIDFENGETFLSVVGLLFRDTRLLGLPIPRHRDFEEVNLRFYVRKRSADTWRRGVVFIREMVPRYAIALIARACYGENYFAVPMNHHIEHLDLNLKVEYSWRRSARKWESLQMIAVGQAQPIPGGAHAEFITEHYWGYTRVRSGCSEYRVEHPRWKIWEADNFSLDADITTLYGEQFVETLSAQPRSAFIADGSPITVAHKSLLL